MGCRSDVRVVTTHAGWDYFQSNLCDETIEAFFPEEVDEGYADVVFGWDYVNWDTTDEYVRDVLEALNCIGYNDEPYEFARVGEDIFEPFDNNDYFVVNSGKADELLVRRLEFSVQLKVYKNQHAEDLHRRDAEAAVNAVRASQSH